MGSTRQTLFTFFVCSALFFAKSKALAQDTEFPPDTQMSCDDALEGYDTVREKFLSYPSWSKNQDLKHTMTLEQLYAKGMALASQLAIDKALALLTKQIKSKAERLGSVLKKNSQSGKSQLDQIIQQTDDYYDLLGFADGFSETLSSDAQSDNFWKISRSDFETNYLKDAKQENVGPFLKYVTDQVSAQCRDPNSTRSLCLFFLGKTKTLNINKKIPLLIKQKQKQKQKESVSAIDFLADYLFHSFQKDQEQKDKFLFHDQFFEEDLDHFSFLESIRDQSGQIYEQGEGFSKKLAQTPPDNSVLDQTLSELSNQIQSHREHLPQYDEERGTARPGDESIEELLMATSAAADGLTELSSDAAGTQFVEDQLNKSKKIFEKLSEKEVSLKQRHSNYFDSDGDFISCDTLNSPTASKAHCRETKSVYSLVEQQVRSTQSYRTCLEQLKDAAETPETVLNKTYCQLQLEPNEKEKEKIEQELKKTQEQIDQIINNTLGTEAKHSELGPTYEMMQLFQAGVLQTCSDEEDGKYNDKLFTDHSEKSLLSSDCQEIPMGNFVTLGSDVLGEVVEGLADPSLDDEVFIGYARKHCSEEEFKELSYCQKITSEIERVTDEMRARETLATLGDGQKSSYDEYFAGEENAAVMQKASSYHGLAMTGLGVLQGIFLPKIFPRVFEANPFPGYYRGYSPYSGMLTGAFDSPYYQSLSTPYAGFRL